MSAIIVLLAVLVVSLIAGYLLISRVPPLLHTPLMSLTNAMSAVTVLGALLLFTAPAASGELLLASLAILSATFNLVGGFAITERMLRLFRKR